MSSFFWLLVWEIQRGASLCDYASQHTSCVHYYRHVRYIQLDVVGFLLLQLPVDVPRGMCCVIRMCARQHQVAEVACYRLRQDTGGVRTTSVFSS